MNDQQSIAAAIGAMEQARQTLYDAMGTATEANIDSAMGVVRVIHTCPDPDVAGRLDATLATAMRKIGKATESATIEIETLLTTLIDTLTELLGESVAGAPPVQPPSGS